MDTLDVMLAGATVGQAALCASVLLMRSARAPTGLPLAGFFCAFGAIASAPLLHASFPLAPALFPAIAAPTFFLLGPMLWFYVEGLTSETAWRPRTAHVWHFVPALLGLMASAMIAAMDPTASGRKLSPGRRARPVRAGDRLDRTVGILCREDPVSPRGLWSANP